MSEIRHYKISVSRDGKINGPWIILFQLVLVLWEPQPRAGLALYSTNGVIITYWKSPKIWQVNTFDLNDGFTCEIIAAFGD